MASLDAPKAQAGQLQSAKQFSSDDGILKTPSTRAHGQTRHQPTMLDEKRQKMRTEMHNSRNHAQSKMGLDKSYSKMSFIQKGKTKMQQQQQKSSTVAGK